MKMGDGLNQARAMRIAEIINDFRNIMTYISGVRANPGQNEANEEGYIMLRRCITDAQNLLAVPFDTENGMTGRQEQDKVVLRRIITDAAVRRFHAQKIYNRVTACLRWVNARAAVLQGQSPRPQHANGLQQVQQLLHAELAQITDQRIYQSLLSADQQAGKWISEDPSLQVLSQRTANANSNNGGRS